MAYICSVNAVINTQDGDGVANKKQTLSSEYAEMTHEELAGKINMTRNGVIQVEKRAMDKVKKALKEKNIKFKDLL